MRVLAQDMVVSVSSMKLDLNEKLRYHPKRRCNYQLLTEKARKKRLTKPTMLNLVEPGGV